MSIQKIQHKVVSVAEECGWTISRVTEWCIVLSKKTEEDVQKANVYWSKKTLAGEDIFTVQTTVTHPQKGRAQLNRNGMTFAQISGVLMQPRLHTGKGYYKRVQK